MAEMRITGVQMPSGQWVKIPEKNEPELKPETAEMIRAIEHAISTSLFQVQAELCEKAEVWEKITRKKYAAVKNLDAEVKKIYTKMEALLEEHKALRKQIGLVALREIGTDDGTPDWFTRISLTALRLYDFNTTLHECVFVCAGKELKADTRIQQYDLGTRKYSAQHGINLQFIEVDLPPNVPGGDVSQVTVEQEKYVPFYELEQVRFGQIPNGYRYSIGVRNILRMRKESVEPLFPIEEEKPKVTPIKLGDRVAELEARIAELEALVKKGKA